MTTMVDPSKLSREVKGLVADFREELKLRDPWDREIDIQFKRIQRKYKEILFDFPFARQAHSVDQALWTDTSYALITRYRARIDPVRSSPANNKNVVENRKILQKFLAFLASEGSFWSGIVSRLARVHGLTEANNALAALEMNAVEFENRETLARREAIGTSTGGLDEVVAPSHPPTTQEQRSNKLLTVFRALIYLGDLARYREQYGTHPNKSNPDAGSKRSRGGRRGRDKGSDRSHEKPYAKAEAFYVQARLLLPDYGNPFNQLAIVYANQRDYFEAALNYYRALCVRKPFPTAQDNLVRSLSKCFEVDRDLWRTRRAQEADGNVDNDPEMERGGRKGKARNGKTVVDIDGSKDLESKFKQDVVLLHALWTGKCRPAKLARHTHNVLASFASLIARRLLPTATIVHVLVLALGALWKVRMFEQDDKPRLNSRRSKGKARDDEPDEDVPLESIITAHLLSLCTVLLEIGTQEIQEGVREVAEASERGVGDPYRLAQRITGTFRRTLPALRIATKWIKANAKYIQQYSAETPTEDDLPVLRPNAASFWQAWASFETMLVAAFPLELLSPWMVQLEEDIDMRGFSPLRWSSTGSKGETEREEVDGASVHPNEEQLMRIRDLIVDGKYIASLPESPVSIAGQDFVFDAQQSGQSVSDHAHYGNWEQRETGHLDDESESDHGEEPLDDDDELPDPDDDRATVSTRTEDDPVRLAMDAVLTEDEDDEEQILYPQRYTHRQVNVSTSPPESPSPLAEPGVVPAWPPPTPSFLSIGSNNRAAQPNETRLPKRAGTTAEDLLNHVLNGTPTFLNMSSVSGSEPPSVSISTTPFVGRTMSVPGPTPSFLAPSTQSSAFPAYPPRSPPHNGFSPRSNQNIPTPSPFPSFSSRPSSFSGTRSTNPFPSAPLYSGGRMNEPVSTFFDSHTRVASLSGATSIWTPAPQEVSGSVHLEVSPRTGSMRANPISGKVLRGLHEWPGRNDASREALASSEFVGTARQRTYTNPGGMAGRG